MENFNSIHYLTNKSNEERHNTNIYFRYFFLFVCVIWVGCWIPVILSDTKYNGLSGNRTLKSIGNMSERAKLWNVSDCSPYSVYSGIYAVLTKPTSNKTSNNEEQNGHFINFLELFCHIFTFDPTYLADCSNLLYPMYFFLTGFMSVCGLYTTISIFSSSNIEILKKQPSVIATIFFFVVLIEHSSELLISLFFPKLWPYDGRLVYWLVPEAITIAIIRRKMISIRSNNDEENKDPYTYRIIPFSYYTYALIYGFSFVYILQFIVISTMSALHKTDSTNIFYLLMVVCSYIMYYTIYYVGIMSTSYATNIWIDKKKFHLKDLWRALYIISRYHCGTACLHVIPKLAKSETYNRGKIKLYDYGYTENSDPQRYEWLKKKSSKHYRLSRVLTATQGYNWSDTISIVSDLIATNPMHKYFSSFGEGKPIIFGVLLPINYLSHLLIWHFGVFNTNIAEASWFMYLMIGIAFNLVIPFFKTASDTIGLRMLRHELLSDRPVQMDEIAFTEEL